MAIKVDTSKVETAATKIEAYNKKIRDDFTPVNDALNVLNRNWDGGASDNAIRTFNSIREGYLDHRYTAISNLVSFLRVQVSSDYTETEKRIKSAADAFK